MNLQQDPSIESKALTFHQVLATWLPLVASWMLMSIELPTINAIVARLSNPEINLAAYGGVVFPIALTIEAPVIMLLAASTALSRDWESYQRLKKYTLWMGGILMGLHLLVALTPFYDFIVNVLLSSPKEIIEPARVSLLMLAPWTLSIAYRRFQQGAMIRFGHSRMVGETTFVRLVTVAVVLTVGMVVKTIPGALLAGLAQGLGVLLESIYAGVRIRKIHSEIKAAPSYEKPLTLKRFVSFYFPLAITSYLWLIWQPLISGTVSRMPNPLESLAVWSLVTGILFMFRSPGVAFKEAVVALQKDAKSYMVLQRFACLFSLITTVSAIVFVVSPLSRLWFTYVANLSTELVTVATFTLLFGILLPFISMYISLFQGIIVNQEKTSLIPEAVLVCLVSMGVVLAFGLITKAYKGVYIASAAFTTAHLTQCLWLFIRSRNQRKELVNNS